MIFKKFHLLFTGILFLIYIPAQSQTSVRLKEIASIEGIRENQLTGFGLVTGLAGKGDSSENSMLKSMLSGFLSNFGLTIPEKELKSKNCAVVTVTCEIPGFIRSGDKLNVTVSSIGDAKSLEGGILMQTALKAANGNIYAVAQGPITVPPGKNIPKTIAGITNGAIVEREVLSRFINQNTIRIVLRYPDFTTMNALLSALKEKFKTLVMSASDASLISITLPDDYKNDPVPFIAQLEQISVSADTSGKVVVNSKSGIVVIGKNVKIGKVAVSCRDAKITIGKKDNWSEDPKEQFVFPETSTVDDLVSALRELGITTDTIIEILIAIQNAGALFGELIIL